MSRKDGCKLRPLLDPVFCLFGQGNHIFIREKTGKCRAILKSDVCGNYKFGFWFYIRQLLTIFFSLMTLRGFVLCLDFTNEGIYYFRFSDH